VTDSLPQDVLLPNDTGAQVRHGVLVAGVRLLVPVGTRSELGVVFRDLLIGLVALLITVVMSSLCLIWVCCLMVKTLI
jgi:hypothetical protein